MVDPRGFVAAGLSVLAVIAIFLGLFTDGWVSAEWDEKYEETENSASYTAGGTLHIGLLEAESSSGSSSTTIDLSDLKGEDKDWNTGGLIAYIILWAALLVCLGAIPCAIFAGLHKMSKIPGMVLGYVGGGLMILAAVLYIIIVPHKLEGVDEISFGWTLYVVVVGGGVQAVAGDLVRGIRGKSRAPMRRSSPAPGWGAPERSSRREDYYGERRGIDYPPRRRDDYYDDRGRREPSAHPRNGHRNRQRDDYYDDRGRRGSSAHPRDDHRDRRRRRDDHYDDRDRHSSSSGGIPHTLTVFKCPECGAAIMEDKCPYCGWRK